MMLLPVPRRTLRCMPLLLVLLMGAAACAPQNESVIGASNETTAAPTTTTSTTAPSTTSGVPTTTVAISTTVAESTTTTEPPPSTTQPSGPLLGLGLEVVAEGLGQPTSVSSPPGEDRLYVTERLGTIHIIDPDDGLLPDPFMDLTDRLTAIGIEQGLLGLVFHPEFEENRRFFVYSVNVDGQRQLAEFTANAEGTVGERDSERVLFALDQPAGSVDIRHYAGNLAFGPDGMLYASLGDGADFSNQGQNPETLFATIIRIDVDSGDPYGIPDDNPFVDGGGAAEVWAYGLRNPWRFGIDPVDGLIYIGDVGQAQWEEVSVLPLDSGGGANLGWPIVEGTHCLSDPACDSGDTVPPVLEYSHDDGCSVTGGPVYRGTQIPELQGHYFYADWCGQWVRTFRYQDGEVTEEQDWSEDLPGAGQVNAFGVNGAGELFIANFAGTVAKIVPVR